MTVNASEILKAYFPDPADTSARAQAILQLRADLNAVQIRYTRLGLHVLRGLSHPAGEPHDDNTGRPCRFDLCGHDCCATCNDAEKIILALANGDAG